MNSLRSARKKKVESKQSAREVVDWREGHRHGLGELRAGQGDGLTRPNSSIPRGRRSVSRSGFKREVDRLRGHARKTTRSIAGEIAENMPAARPFVRLIKICAVKLNFDSAEATIFHKTRKIIFIGRRNLYICLMHFISMCERKHCRYDIIFVTRLPRSISPLIIEDFIDNSALC